MTTESCHPAARGVVALDLWHVAAAAGPAGAGLRTADRPPAVRKRETTALAEAMAELGVKSGTIVTRDEHEPIESDHDPIKVVPAWRFLLDLPAAPEAAGT